jgi:hypothetical protein
MIEVKEDHGGNQSIVCDGVKVASVEYVITSGGKGSRAWTGPDHLATRKRAEWIADSLRKNEGAKP